MFLSAELHGDVKSAANDNKTSTLAPAHRIFLELLLTFDDPYRTGYNRSQPQVR